MKSKAVLRLRKVAFDDGSQDLDGFEQKMKWSPSGGFGL